MQISGAFSGFPLLTHAFVGAPLLSQPFLAFAVLCWVLTRENEHFQKRLAIFGNARFHPHLAKTWTRSFCNNKRPGKATKSKKIPGRTNKAQQSPETTLKRPWSVQRVPRPSQNPPKTLPKLSQDPPQSLPRPSPNRPQMPQECQFYLKSLF